MRASSRHWGGPGGGRRKLFLRLFNFCPAGNAQMDQNGSPEAVPGVPKPINFRIKGVPVLDVCHEYLVSQFGVQFVVGF